MAYELLAAKGFKDGMVHIFQINLKFDARANNKTTNGKTKGLVTDKLVLQNYLMVNTTLGVILKKGHV